MLFDLEYAKDGSGRGRPKFFQANIKAGVLHISPELYS
jgi:hypothetical protein